MEVEKMVIGVDPGQSGGVAVIGRDRVLKHAIRMPVLQRSKRKVVDSAAIMQMLRAACDDDLSRIEVVVLEAVSAMPRQGVTSMFNFGRAAGAVEAVALMTGAPVEWITPRVWKGHYGLGSNKRASLDMARLKFGESHLWGVLANDGIAEAALLALYWMDKRG